MVSKKTKQRMNAANRVSNAVPRSVRMPRVKVANGVTTVTGSDMLGQINVGQTGQIVGLNANPYSGTTWLARQASLYNKYKYVSCRLRYVPFIPTSTPGRLVMGFQADPGDTIPASTTVVSQLQGAREVPVWMETSTSIGPIRKPEFTVSGTSSSDSSPGQFVVATDFGPSTTIACGSVYLDYTINFWNRTAYASQA